MVKITYIEANGNEHTVEAKVGNSVMEAAIKNSVPGIAADCGGSCACATCRVYVGEEWAKKLAEAEETETAMLEFVEDYRSGARLSCQLPVTEALDGLVVHMPESQH